MVLPPETLRLLTALSLVILYGVLCGAVYWRARPRRVAATARGWLVAHASQTGTAYELAQHSAALLRVAGAPVQVLPLGQVTVGLLQQSERLLLVLSTYGDGEAPDAALAFTGRVMSLAPALTGLHYGLLALGSRDYPQFCGFGRTVDAWLQTQGATPCFERIDVNDADPQAVARWRQELSHLAGTQDVPDWRGPGFSDWRLQSRRLLNPGSQGEAVYELALAPAAAAEADWQAGDLVQLRLEGESKPRDYSIANLPGEGVIRLMVRRHRRPDGSMGRVSGWLSEASLGDMLRLRISPHPAFRIGTNRDRPLILIGNGTGLAGLLAHLRQRVRQAPAASCWLVFGERQRAHDAFCEDELSLYHRQGRLARLDRVFSRDGGDCPYVQDHLARHWDDVGGWLDQGAAIYVCGSLQGMAQAVDALLRQRLGEAGVQELAAAGRYCRDVY